MSDKNKNKKGILKNFIRYSEGRMSGEDRNSFERELQKDPFSEEAEEGYSMLPADTIKGDISILKVRMVNRLKQRRTMVFYRIAASVTILLILSGILIVSQKKKRIVTLSENLIKKEVETPFTIRIPEPITGPATKSSDETNVVVPSVLQESKVDDLVASVEYEKEQQIAEIQKEEPEKVILKDSEITYAEKAITPSGEAVKKSVEVENNIDMARSAAIPAAAKSESPREYLAPQPVVGIDSFNLYLEKNIRYTLLKEFEEQVVVVRFTVQTDSTIMNIKIITSPGQPWSDEAIRLIKEGPAWNPATENGKAIEDDVSVRIIFR